MKIVTKVALLEKGLGEATKSALRPKSQNYEDATFRNLDEFTIEGGTFSDAFIRSWNTTFIGFADDIGADTPTREVREVFGLGLEGHSGVATFDGSVPEVEGDDKAAGMIGQGEVQANALNMASVAATAATGNFRRPILIFADLDRREIAETDRSLPGNAAEHLRGMMRCTATQGTASKALSGLTGDIGAKAGSTEVGGAEVSDSWFTGFCDDAAVAAVTEASGHGRDAAGPVVRDILTAGDRHMVTAIGRSGYAPGDDGQPSERVRTRLNRLLLYGAFVLIVMTALIAVLRQPATGPEEDRVDVGQVCRSHLAPGLELPCGSEGFGDLRYVCPSPADGDRCARTTVVTVHNESRSTACVSVISRPRQGVREQNAEVRVAPGGMAVLRPGRSDYLFDVTIRTVEEFPAVLKVTRVR